MQLFLELRSGMAKSVDPDQTTPSGAVWSGSALFAYAILLATSVYEILGLMTQLCTVHVYHNGRQNIEKMPINHLFPQQTHVSKCDAGQSAWQVELFY